MASQEEKVEGTVEVTTPAQDAAEFSGAWDKLEAEASGQSVTAAERPEAEAGKEDQGGDEAGQGEAKAGQPDASASPGADADEASREQTSDDVWAKADPKLREAHETALTAAKEQAKKAENLARSNGGRLSKALNELDALRKAAPSGDAGQADETAKQRKERVELARRDYPEVAEPLLEEIADLRAKVDGLQSSATARAESDVVDALSDEAAALVGRHSDFAAIVKAPEYAEWLKGQPPSIQRIVQENSQAIVSAADTAMVFDAFKRETKWGAKPEPTAEELSAARLRAEQLDGGRSATGATQPGVRSDTKTDATFDGEWDRLDRADKQKAAGRR